MKITILAVLLSICFLSIIYFLTGFRSAFEADQQCHYELSNNFSQAATYGCDHDLETRQWLLFDASQDNQPAKVVKRFRY